MADNLDAPGLMSPNANAKTDITDIYAFQKPGDPEKSILILNVNPLAPTLATEFESNGLYQLKIDTNGDARAEIAFRIQFTAAQNGKQWATVRRDVGSRANSDQNTGEVIIKNAPVSFGSHASVTESEDYKFFAGIRSDPFFFDLVGFLHNFQFTGSDFFIDKNVFSMVLSATKSQLLGPNARVGYWARCLVLVDGIWTQKDRMGRPAINTVFNHGADKNTFNGIPPTEDRSLFLDKFVAVLEGPPFNRDAATATTLASVLLPDILTYDYANAGGFLNGRRLEDDVIDAELQLLTGSATISDFVGPHTDYLSVFPYIGTPH